MTNIFLSEIQAQCIELESRTFHTRDKEFHRKTFYIAFDRFFHAFWVHLGDNYECRDFFLNLRIRHANEIKIIMEREHLRDVRACLVRQTKDIYEGFRDYLIK